MYQGKPDVKGLAGLDSSDWIRAGWMDRLGSVRRSQAGQVSNMRAVRYQRSRQRIVRVTSRVQ
ncbi:unnamed protein product [Staurois parvus]|uniref:Uncharacterized protein n=1 Tax=Staurois parvus TaxID=386267 RepID=A0ABN9BUX7_9NEOB|nr:unnamed protein product [Staurois parvus]